MVPYNFQIIEFIFLHFCIYLVNRSVRHLFLNLFDCCFGVDWNYIRLLFFQVGHHLLPLLVLYHAMFEYFFISFELLRTVERHGFVFMWEALERWLLWVWHGWKPLRRLVCFLLILMLILLWRAFRLSPLLAWFALFELLASYLRLRCWWIRVWIWLLYFFQFCLFLLHP